ncbi:LTXXQ motif family protein [Nitrosomonas eutropha]|uniref:LTXXQ motif family protein n=1 Tax=Nitrosomonas eutropha TaxID=916 RepID=A0A1I7GR30_9PROT|nr:Spy/CpxP family protein refolding chaperone [Nitrosomonas eutropha]SFU50869.1 LTXXQ motif family protein [Nitrosomonas eutropha]
MNIRLTGLSILIGALFAIPATAVAVSPVAGTSIWQSGASSLVLAEAQQNQTHTREGEGKGQGYSNEGQGGQGEQGKGECKGKNKGGEDSDHSGHSGHDHGGKSHHGHHHHSYAHNIAGQAEALDLSDEQLGKIVRIHLKEDPKVHDHLKKKMKESMKAFRKAVAQPAVDEETLRTLGQDHVNSFNEMVAYHIEERKAIRSILTPEQIKKLKDVKTEHDH